MPYYRLLTDKTLLVLRDEIYIGGKNPLQDNSSNIVKTWYLDPTLPVADYRAVRSAIMAEVDALRAPPKDEPPGAQEEGFH